MKKGWLALAIIIGLSLSGGQLFAQADKPIASICHGAQLLAAADVLEDKS